MNKIFNPDRRAVLQSAGAAGLALAAGAAFGQQAPERKFKVA